MNAKDRAIIKTIKKYGCQVIHVLEDEKSPPFSYSLGIQQTAGAPEVIVMGLRQEMAHFVVNEYNNRICAGEVFSLGKEYDGFLEGFPVLFENVLARNRDRYLCWGNWLYKGNPFSAVQMIYPTTTGVWPWERKASAWFRRYQPLLGQRGTQRRTPKAEKAPKDIRISPAAREARRAAPTQARGGARRAEPRVASTKQISPGRGGGR